MKNVLLTSIPPTKFSSIYFIYLCNFLFQFDFQDKRELTGITTMGGGSIIYQIDNFPSWVSQFKIKYSPDGHSWNYIDNDFGQPLVSLLIFYTMISVNHFFLNKS